MLESRGISKTVLMFTLFMILLWVPRVSPARVEWRALDDIVLKENPLDVAADLDGNILFVLVPRKILIYSVRQRRVMRVIPFEGSFDRLLISLKSNRLILYSSKGKSIKVIEPEVILSIDYSGLPRIGPPQAPVTIAVFSDYQ
ncbi:MAG: hypothetical protein JRH06_01550 [Deltaproteobacteria bacterium]|nr:hypothetical protein [Deltaproteobacteria bacterium]MBW2136226.1 hypothetical protein [Deltaproteobacteria bacterium]